MDSKGRFTFSRRSLGVVLAVIMFVIGGLYLSSLLGGAGENAQALEVDRASSEGEDLEVAPEQGALAPDFTLQSLDGEEVRLIDLRGRPVVINFWATWCGPCRIEMPALESRFQRYQEEGLALLAVNFDEPERDVKEFVKEFGLTFTILLDPGAEVQRLYRNRTYPTTFFINAEGVIELQHFGPMTEDQIDANLARVGLGEGP